MVGFNIIPILLLALFILVFFVIICYIFIFLHSPKSRPAIIDTHQHQTRTASAYYNSRARQVVLDNHGQAFDNRNFNMNEENLISPSQANRSPFVPQHMRNHHKISVIELPPPTYEQVVQNATENFQNHLKFEPIETEASTSNKNLNSTTHKSSRIFQNSSKFSNLTL